MPIHVEGKDATEIEKELALCLSVARKQPDGGLKCQWLAEVALHTKDLKKAEKIVAEALDAAREQLKPHLIVSAAAWPVSVLTHRNSKCLSRVVNDLVTLIEAEPNAIQRGEALFLLFEAVYPDPKQRSNVLGLLLKTCAGMKSWKRGQILEETAVTLALDEPVQMQRVFDVLGEGKWSRRARRRIELGYIGPHRFMPYYQRVAKSTIGSDK